MRDTWFWHCPFLTSEQVTGFRYFPNTSHVHCTGTEFIQVTFLKVADLWVQKCRQIVSTALRGRSLVMVGGEF